MLHIVNKSHMQTNALQTCLRMSRPGDALLLIEDAIYATTVAGAALAGLSHALEQMKVYALQPDVEARGMADKLAEGVIAIDYAGFVELVVEHPNNQSWL